MLANNSHISSDNSRSLLSIRSISISRLAKELGGGRSFMYFISHLNQLKRSAMNENQTKHMSIKVFLFPPGPTISGIILGEDEKWSPIDWKTKKDEKCFD